ncbi:putative glycosyltransferase family 20 protein 2 [Elsinoe fawcettii]|nr:putative glycosyltransferase family 20 protein 2 [Elsinoe fawcettii]
MAGNDKVNKPRLIVVSNRLPITIKQDPDSKKYVYKKSSGGLVSGMAGCLKGREHIWYGWPGLQVPPDQCQAICDKLEAEYSARPIFLDEKMADKHYNEFSNEILWPVLHYHPGEALFDEAAYQAYQKVNDIFARHIMADIRDGDIVWIHDYHLMMLPLRIRDMATQQGVDIKIGFFLHTPFPSPEMYRALPCRVAILEGLLAADLVGFHTYDYAKHFLTSCYKTVSAKVGTKFIEHKGRKTGVGAFPIGIDPDKFVQGISDAKVLDYIKKYKAGFDQCTTIIGIDRLDYIKGVPHKLQAFQHLLHAHPELVGKVKLVQIAVPSREDVPEYQALKRRINELVGLINGTYGSVDFIPVHLKHMSCGEAELTALFTMSDVCLVSSTRDGMNLVAYEYVACQVENHGVLVLSEFAGCAQSFASGAVVCNPWNTGELADSIYEALMMSEKEKSDRHQALWDYVHRYTSAWWGQAFLEKLNRTADQIAGREKVEVMEISRRCVIEAIDRELAMKHKVPRKKISWEEPGKKYWADMAHL